MEENEAQALCHIQASSCSPPCGLALAHSLPMPLTCQTTPLGSAGCNMHITGHSVGQGMGDVAASAAAAAAAVNELCPKRAVHLLHCLGAYCQAEELTWVGGVL